MYARYNPDFMSFVEGRNFVRTERRNNWDDTVDVTYTKFDVYPSFQIVLNVAARRRYCASRGAPLDWPSP